MENYHYTLKLWLPLQIGVVFVFLFKFPVSFINFMQYCVQYREFLNQKLSIWALILIISSFMRSTAPFHLKSG